MKGDPSKILLLYEVGERYHVCAEFYWGFNPDYGRQDGHGEVLAELYEKETGNSAIGGKLEPKLCQSRGGCHGICISIPNKEM